MIDLFHFVVLFGFITDFLFSDLATGGMEAKHFLFWGILALLINLGVGTITLLIACGFCAFFVFLGEWLTDRIPMLGAGDWYFVAVSTLLFPFPDYFSMGIPVGIAAFLFGGLSYLLGTLYRRRKIEFIPFAPFICIGLLFTVLMIVFNGTNY